MTSISTLGSTAITVQFDLDREIDGAASDVQAAINAASGQLPKDLPSPPTYRKVNPAEATERAAQHLGSGGATIGRGGGGVANHTFFFTP
jgi:multidrug efflux pump subunit AcrB